ncbi:MAG: hypothetical protein ACHP84_08385 [Caulobacterales bacterium]
MIELKASASVFCILRLSPSEWMTAMTLLRYALAASVAACLAGGVAVAQTAPASPPASSISPAAPTDQATPAPTEKATPATPATSAGVNTSVTVDANGNRHLLISNAPVPDTPQNRAKYGAPLSNAGRHTPAAGN